MTDPVLFVTVGLPASGKSTFARSLEERGVVHLDRDRIRNRFGFYSRISEMFVMGVLENSAKGHLFSGRSVVVDANHVAVAQRAQVLQWAKDLAVFASGPSIRKALLYFDTPHKLAIARDLERERTVGADVIEKQQRNFVPPMAQEEDVLVIKLGWELDEKDPFVIERVLELAQEHRGGEYEVVVASGDLP